MVDSVRPLVDLLLVTFHGGSEGAKAIRTGEAAESLGAEPRGDLRRWARAVIDAGADAVIGHGPHVLRGMEFYRGRLIAYSLGNFVTYRGFNLVGPAGHHRGAAAGVRRRGRFGVPASCRCCSFPRTGRLQIRAAGGATGASTFRRGLRRRRRGNQRKREIWDPRRAATSATP